MRCVASVRSVEAQCNDEQFTFSAPAVTSYDVFTFMSRVDLQHRKRIKQRGCRGVEVRGKNCKFWHSKFLQCLIIDKYGAALKKNFCFMITATPEMEPL